jgi:collagen triple helix repeat protein
MSRFKHRLKEPFGKAGLTVAILALVLATTGAAFAAAGLSGKQKKEVTKIAKQFAKAGPEGKQGPAGPTGPAGSNGSNGEKGTTGNTGPQGNPGTSVTNTKLNSGNAECPEGGAEFKVGSGAATYACNGVEGTQGPKGDTGAPWTPNNTLPKNATEKGTINIVPAFQETELGLLEAQWTQITFPIPLEAGLDASHTHVIFIGEGAGEASEAAAITNGECTGNVTNPGAASGQLCVFDARPEILEESSKTLMYTMYPAIAQPYNNEVGGPPSSDGGGTGTTGALVPTITVELTSPAAEQVSGTWAVTG